MASLKDKVKDRAAQDARVDGQDEPGRTLPIRQDGRVPLLRNTLKLMEPEFGKALPRHIGTDRFLRMAITCVQQTPKLLDCTPESVLGAFMQAARLGLEPGTKEAAVVPFRDKATFIPQWQGLVQLMLRSGQVASVTADFIREADQWHYQVGGKEAGFWHRPDLLAADQGERLLAYAYVELTNGGTRAMFTNRAEAIEIRDTYSENYKYAERTGKRNSTWHTDFNPMWLKCPVRRIADWVPSSPELREFLARSDADGAMPVEEVDHAPAGAGTVTAEVVRDEPQGEPEPEGEPEEEDSPPGRYPEDR